MKLKKNAVHEIWMIFRKSARSRGLDFRTNDEGFYFVKVIQNAGTHMQLFDEFVKLSNETVAKFGAENLFSFRKDEAKLRRLVHEDAAGEVAAQLLNAAQNFKTSAEANDYLVSLFDRLGQAYEDEFLSSKHEVFVVRDNQDILEVVSNDSGAKTARDTFAVGGRTNGPIRIVKKVVDDEELENLKRQIVR